MLFSVLISVYYKENPYHLIQSLESVFDQTLLPAEVVLVKDGTLTVELDAAIDMFVNKYNDKLKIITLPENVGLGKALNEGLMHCSCELVARMDSDDICKKDRFEKQLTIFEQNQSLSVVGSWIDEFVDTPENIVSIRKLPEKNNELISYAKTRNPMNHPSVMFKKSDILAVGGYKHFYLLEDYYLWTRLIMEKYELYNIQESLLLFRTSPEMIARRGGLRYTISELKFFHKLYKLHFYGLYHFIKNIIIRLPVRIMPAKLRSYAYQKLLR